MLVTSLDVLSARLLIQTSARLATLLPPSLAAAAMSAVTTPRSATRQLMSRSAKQATSPEVTTSGASLAQLTQNAGIGSRELTRAYAEIIRTLHWIGCVVSAVLMAAKTFARTINGA